MQQDAVGRKKFHFVKGFYKEVLACNPPFFWIVIESALLKDSDLLHIFMPAGLKPSMYAFQCLLFAQKKKKREKLKVKTKHISTCTSCFQMEMFQPKLKAFLECHASYITVIIAPNPFPAPQLFSGSQSFCVVAILSPFTAARATAGNLGNCSWMQPAQGLGKNRGAKYLNQSFS